MLLDLGRPPKPRIPGTTAGGKEERAGPYKSLVAVDAATKVLLDVAADGSLPDASPSELGAESDGGERSWPPLLPLAGERSPAADSLPTADGAMAALEAWRSISTLLLNMVLVAGVVVQRDPSAGEGWEFAPAGEQSPCNGSETRSADMRGHLWVVLDGRRPRME